MDSDLEVKLIVNFIKLAPSLNHLLLRITNHVDAQSYDLLFKALQQNTKLTQFEFEGPRLKPDYLI